MAERPWSEQAEEILACLRNYHPLLQAVQWSEEWEYPVLALSVQVGSVGGCFYDGIANLSVSVWDPMANEEKRLEVTEMAARLLSRIQCIDCLPDYQVGEKTLREWLPD